MLLVNAMHTNYVHPTSDVIYIGTSATNSPRYIYSYIHYKMVAKLFFAYSNVKELPPFRRIDHGPRE